jgi:holo-[acyl-carrier protein] synthase
VLPASVRATRLLGIDLVAVTEVAAAVERFGGRYVNRVYTPSEIAYCTAHGRSARSAAPHFAARFAAKEATFKALRGGDEPLDWRSIEVVRRADGSCTLSLHGAARRLARERGLTAIDVSLSHDGDYAVAVVVGEARGCSAAEPDARPAARPAATASRIARIRRTTLKRPRRAQRQ